MSFSLTLAYQQRLSHLHQRGLGMVRWLGTSMGPQAQESGSNVVCLGLPATEKVYVALLATFLQRPGGSVESKK